MSSDAQCLLCQTAKARWHLNGCLLVCGNPTEESCSLAKQ